MNMFIALHSVNSNQVSGFQGTDEVDSGDGVMTTKYDALLTVQRVHIVATFNLQRVLRGAVRRQITDMDRDQDPQAWRNASTCRRRSQPQGALFTTTSPTRRTLRHHRAVPPVHPEIH
jgi:hypothetical protein